MNVPSADKNFLLKKKKKLWGREGLKNQIPTY